MKFITILTDGLADYPLQELGGKTPLEAALLPVIDRLAEGGELGMVKTVPQGMSPGSDVANLSLMGYEPERYHTGRSPLEAASMGVELGETDVAFRCNLVTLDGEGPLQSRKMRDHSAGEISSGEARELIERVDRELGSESLCFSAGVSYRHLLVWKNGPWGYRLTPPHDILDRPVAGYLPGGEHGGPILEMMERAVELLEEHPVNRRRREAGKNPANSIWIWGEGRRPKLSPFKDRYGLAGAVISAVDLIHGIGILAGLRSIHVEGATGTIDTNFEGKASAAVEALLGGEDYVYLHVEAPDECGHQGDIQGKVRSIELIDEKVVGPIWEALAASGEPYRIMILPDHPTPISIRTHAAEAVPYLIFDSRREGPGERGAAGVRVQGPRFTEEAGRAAGRFFPDGPALLRHFLDGE
jgi:2,3-bisphosphoglycerate-independent phosphoglycerate mutase